MVREIVDRAWGVKAMQHKKKEPESAPPEEDDPYSAKSLMQDPIGQDISRKRYWVLDSKYLPTGRSQRFHHMLTFIYPEQIHPDYMFQQTLGKSHKALKAWLVPGMNTSRR